jgi:hypothetical protein
MLARYLQASTKNENKNNKIKNSSRKRNELGTLALLQTDSLFFFYHHHQQQIPRFCDVSEVCQFATYQQQ